METLDDLQRHFQGQLPQFNRVTQVTLQGTITYGPHIPPIPGPKENHRLIQGPAWFYGRYVSFCWRGTPWKVNSSPLKIDNPKRKLIFQPSFFRGYVKFRGCITLGSPQDPDSISWGFWSPLFRNIMVDPFFAGSNLQATMEIQQI